MRNCLANLNNMWPFTKKQKPIWKEEAREFLRQERSVPDSPYDSLDIFNVYGVKYTNLIGGETKIEEEWELV